MKGGWTLILTLWGGQVLDSHATFLLHGGTGSDTGLLSEKS